MPKDLVAFSYEMIDGEAASKLRCLEGETAKLYGQYKKVSIELAEVLRSAREVLVESGNQGKFKSWLEMVGLPRQTAYDAIAFLDGCEVVGVRPSYTGIPQKGVKLLADPETPPEVVARAKRKDKQGQPVTVAEIKALIDEAKGPEPEEEVEEEPEEIEVTTEDLMKETGLELERFAKSITALGKEAPECAWWTEQRLDGLQAHLRTAARTVRNIKPSGLCPLCGGDGCKPCKQSGWMPKVERDSI